MTMTEPKQTEGHSQAELLADAVLRASGSGLRHYAMITIRSAIIKAAQNGIDQAISAERLKAQVLVDAIEGSNAAFDSIRNVLNDDDATPEEVLVLVNRAIENNQRATKTHGGDK